MSVRHVLTEVFLWLGIALLLRGGRRRHAR